MLLRGSVRVTAANRGRRDLAAHRRPAGPLFLDSYGYGREPSADSAAAVDASGSDRHGWRQYEVELPLPDDVEEMAFGVAVRGAGQRLVRRTRAAHGGDGSGGARGARRRALLDAALGADARALAAARRRRLARRARGSRSNMRAAPRRRPTAHLAVRFAVRELGDRHSYLQSARGRERLHDDGGVERPHGRALCAAAGPAASPAIVAYLHVPGFAGGTPAQQARVRRDAEQHHSIHDEAGVCGWIVDLRQNTGGNLWPMLAGSDRCSVTASSRPPSIPTAAASPSGIATAKPGFGDYTQLRVRSPYRVRAAAPVAVLLGPGTASSAEVLAVAFRGRAATRSFGAPDAGLERRQSHFRAWPTAPRWC